MAGTDIMQLTEPFALFGEWMKEAQAHPHIREATAMSVTTASSLNELHSRVVLCKGWDSDGFVFYSNYKSRKGRDLEKNPHASCVFYWDPLFKQVKISGDVQKTSREESEAYWNSRPHDSQLSQFISQQSEKVASREALEKLWQEAEVRFQNKSVPCPEHWGGYRVQPRLIEFWIGQPHRLHDRFQFEKSGSTWTIARLSP